MKHRKLFPSLAETNSTTDCSVPCDQSCTYDCNTDYYYLSPPPPPPPLLADQNSTQNHQISIYAIVIVSFLAGFFLLISNFVIMAKSCRSRNNRQVGDERSSYEEFVDENRIDHPIWFISTNGLQQSVINSITVCQYKKGEGLIQEAECSVCLNEFQEDEMLRLLPKCNHAFHVSCIDTWLRSRTNCPVCRSGIVFESFDDVRELSMASRGVHSGNMDGISATRLENSEIEGELGLGRENQDRISDVPENRGRTGDGGHVSKEKQVIIRRSISMDSSAGSSLRLALENLRPLESEGVNSQDRRPNSGKKSSGNSSTFAELLHLTSIPMKRSFSCNGRFSPSKHGLSPNGSQ